jgi:hypothetical protein
VSGWLEVLGQLSEIGATIKSAGDRLIVRAGARPIPAVLVTRIRVAKLALLAALDEATDWRDRHQEALAHWSVLHPASEAERLSWGELQVRWRRLHGELAPEWQCAGCTEPIGGREALPVDDGNRVHLDDAHGLDCIIAYGERWRGAATRALVAMGLRPPPGMDAP